MLNSSKNSSVLGGKDNLLDLKKEIAIRIITNEAKLNVFKGKNHPKRERERKEERKKERKKER